jgi:hypothetical protein
MEKMENPWIKTLKQRGYHTCNLVNAIRSRDSSPSIGSPEEDGSRVLFSLSFSQIDRITSVQYAGFKFGMKSFTRHSSEVGSHMRSFRSWKVTCFEFNQMFRILKFHEVKLLE